MSSRPERWEMVTIAEVNRYSGRTVDPSASPREAFELYSVPAFPTRRPEVVLGSEVGSTKQTVEPDDVLVCKINPRINRVWRVGQASDLRQVASSEWIAVRNRDLNPRYLQLFFSSPGFRELLCDGVTGVGGSLTRAQPKRVAEFSVPLAPLDEQKRIADKLDALLARVDACRDRLDRVPAILKRFRQAVLQAATNGQLTDDWRRASGNVTRESWEATTLERLCVPSRVITYGVIKLGEEIPGGVPCLRTSNVRWLRIDTEGMKRIEPSLSAEFARTVLTGGEVLVNVRGTLGGVGVASPEMRGWNVSREVAVVPCDVSRVLPAYLAYWIGAESSQRRLAKLEKGVAYTGINIEDLRMLDVDVPIVREQAEIVRRVEALFALADTLEARLATARAQVERLTPALLSKAFRGELVPQDPNDEPASVLLARLRQGQVQAGPAAGKQTGRASTSAAQVKSSAR